MNATIDDATAGSHTIEVFVWYYIADVTHEYNN